MVRLGDYVKIKTGKLDANASSDNGIYPFFTCSKEPLAIDTYSYDCECVLVSGNGDLNVKYYSGKFDAYQRTYIVESNDKEKLFVRYLYYFLDKYVETLRVQSIGGVIKYIKLGNLTEAKIPLPPLDEQRKIAAVLDKVSDLIAKRRQQLDKLDEMVKARFVEMFGNPISNPKGLPVKTLKQLSLLITNGTTPKGGSENYVEDGILFIRSQNVWRNHIVLDDVAFINESTHYSMRKSSVKHKDILITKTGRINTENSSLGRAALYLGNDDSANINGHVYLVRLDGSVIPEYVIAILTSEAYRKYIRKVCVGGIDKRQINLDQVEKFPIILPSMALQNQFATFAEHSENTKTSISRSLEKLETLKKALMQEYFG